MKMTEKLTILNNSRSSRRSSDMSVFLGTRELGSDLIISGLISNYSLDFREFITKSLCYFPNQLKCFRSNTRVVDIRLSGIDPEKHLQFIMVICYFHDFYAWTFRLFQNTVNRR